MEQSLVDLYDKLMSNQDLLPPGAAPFQVKPKRCERCPDRHRHALESTVYGEFQLRQLAEQVLEETKKVTGTSAGFIVGGRARELRVQIDPSRLKAYGLTPLQVAGRHSGRKSSVVDRPV